MDPDIGVGRALNCGHIVCQGTPWGSQIMGKAWVDRKKKRIWPTLGEEYTPVQTRKFVKNDKIHHFFHKILTVAKTGQRSWPRWPMHSPGAELGQDTLIGHHSGQIWPFTYTDHPLADV